MGTYYSLNASCGAGCCLTKMSSCINALKDKSLNAPSGAGCFLTINGQSFVLIKSFSLNAPCGAECFLTFMCAVNTANIALS